MEANATENISGDTFLAISFWESTVFLADALQSSRSVSIALLAILVVNPSIKKRVHQVENAIKDIWYMVKQVLEALAVQKTAAENRTAANWKTNWERNGEDVYWDTVLWKQGNINNYSFSASVLLIF